jgi:hypothetical protein
MELKINPNMNYENIFYKDGNRYKKFPSGVRKMCKLDDCPFTSSGEYCKKHKPVDLKEGEKKCTRCWKVKPAEQFQRDDVIYTKCKYCLEVQRLSSLRRHQKRREFLLDLKIEKGGSCVDCGSTDLEILEFDHVIGEKIKCVRRIYNYQGMVEEANKTVMRCVNCHMKKLPIVIPEERGEASNKNQVFSRKYSDIARAYVNKVKNDSGGCSECGWFDVNFLQVLHFDHLDLNTKSDNVCRLVQTGRSIDIIKTEIAKCRVLCANCHRKFTLRQFNYPIVDMIKNLLE